MFEKYKNKSFKLDKRHAKMFRERLTFKEFKRLTRGGKYTLWKKT